MPSPAPPNTHFPPPPDETIYQNVLPCSVRTPGNQLPSPRVMEKCLYEEAPRRARGPPTAPRL